MYNAPNRGEHGTDYSVQNHMINKVLLESRKCLLCDFPSLNTCFDGSQYPSVSSDCKPCVYPSITYFCQRCSHLQKLHDSASRTKRSDVYNQYDIYSLSGGSEHLIFEDGFAFSKTRSSRILDHLNANYPLQKFGHFLDVGCGKGSFLSTFASHYPDWSLYGFEPSQKYEEHILKMKNVKQFFYGSLENIRLKFELVAAIHVLEHVENPSVFLKQIHSLLADDGILLIQLPNILDSPFDMIVFDHYSHFSSSVLVAFCKSIGYNIHFVATNWLTREISLGLRKSICQKNQNWYTDINVKLLTDLFTQSADWLNITSKKVHQAALSTNFGVFGTAIAGTWLGNMLGDRLKFFVDEDLAKIGKYHLGKPIVLPKDLKECDDVYLAFPYHIADSIRNRLQKTCKGNFILPPRLTHHDGNKSLVFHI